jgi:signal transduction histidine kinase
MIKITVHPNDSLGKSLVVCHDTVLQSLSELLENAILYSPAGSPVLMRVSEVSRPDGDSCTYLRIRNRGSVPEDVLRTYSHIGVAQNLQSHRSSKRSIGIGLAMAFAAISRAGEA